MLFDIEPGRRTHSVGQLCGRRQSLDHITHLAAVWVERDRFTGPIQSKARSRNSYAVARISSRLYRDNACRPTRKTHLVGAGSFVHSLRVAAPD